MATHDDLLFRETATPSKRRGGPLGSGVPGQVHTRAATSSRSFRITHTWPLWENSAGRPRTVSGLQGYPVSRANEPRELPYVAAYPDAQKGSPRITGSQWPAIFSSTGSQPFPRAEKMVRSSSRSVRLRREISRIRVELFFFNSNFLLYAFNLGLLFMHLPVKRVISSKLRLSSRYNRYISNDSIKFKFKFAESVLRYYKCKSKK